MSADKLRATMDSIGSIEDNEKAKNLEILLHLMVADNHQRKQKYFDKEK